MTDAAADIETLALLGEPTRRRLYEWVAARAEPVGRDDAAATLGITRSLAAFHLDKLADAGLVETEYRRLSGRSGPGAGRPAKLYRRSSRQLELSLPSRRYGLAAEIFARALEQPAGSADPVRDVARQTGIELGQRLGGEPDGGRDVVAAMAGGGYEPRVTDDGTIRLRNCPFHALAEAHRELTCGMNLALAEGLLEGLDEAGYEPHLEPRPGWCCVALRPRP